MAIKISNNTIIDDSRNVVNAGIGTFDSVVVTNELDIPDGDTTSRPVVPAVGSLRYNNFFNVLEFYNGTEWITVSSVPDVKDRGVFGGGSPLLNIIDYITIASTGNAADFGDLSTPINNLAACSSSTRGVFGGGSVPTPTPAPTTNTIDYITIANTSNAIDFGDLTVARQDSAACSSSTRGVFGGGLLSPIFYNIIDYITIATTGDATDFGDLTQSRYGLAACSSSTRGVFGGGISPVTNTIDYITIASTGDATDFGDLTEARRDLAGCSSSVRGVFGGGSPTVNTIDYITIATTGDATDFGDLTVARLGLAACSSSVRGVFGGGNTIDYITIATTGDATDFGDLTQSRSSLAACSNGHGGLL